MLRLFATVVVVSIATSVRADIVLNGVTTTRGQFHFSLYSEEEKTNQWVALGESFSGFTAVAFNSESGVLTLEKDKQRKDVRLQGSSIKDIGPEERARLRSLKGLELAYELARRGDDKIAALLAAYERTMTQLTQANAAPQGKNDREQSAGNTEIIRLRQEAEDVREQIKKVAGDKLAQLLAGKE